MNHSVPDTAKSNDGPAVIEMLDVRFGWAAGAPDILHIDSFDVTRGAHLFIKGRSGTGKTTLLNLLGGIVSPRNGKIRLLQRNVSSLSGAARDRFRADHLGVIFQMFNLVPYLSLTDNVLLPCRFSQRRRNRAIDAGGSLENETARLLDRLELGSKSLSGRPVTQLSQGQQQRAAAARALIGRPEIILADEPTSALDYDVRESFLDLLFAEADAAGATILFVSHDNSLEEMFSHTVALEDINLAAGAWQPAEEAV